MENKCTCGGNCTCGSTADNKTPLNGSAQGTSINVSVNGLASTGSYNFNPYYPKTVVDTEVGEETIIITYIQRAMYSYTTINSSITIAGGVQQIHNPDKVFKEVYGVKDGKLTLLQTIEGRIIPPTLEESYEFDEE